MVCRAWGFQGPVTGSGRGANPSPGMQRGGGSATESGEAVLRAGGSRCANAGGGLAPCCYLWAGGGMGRTEGRASHELLWCQDFKRT